MSDPAQCPLCNRPNGCQLCTQSAYKGPCWCATIKFPQSVLDRVPPEQKNKACICRECVVEAQRQEFAKSPRRLLPGDFYFDAGGLVVFTEAYHLRRGFCCGSGCRHCPYQASK